MKHPRTQPILKVFETATVRNAYGGFSLRLLSEGLPFGKCHNELGPSVKGSDAIEQLFVCQRFFFGKVDENVKVI